MSSDSVSALTAAGDGTASAAAPSTATAILVNDMGELRKTTAGAQAAPDRGAPRAHVHASFPGAGGHAPRRRRPGPAPAPCPAGPQGPRARAGAPEKEPGGGMR